MKSNQKEEEQWVDGVWIASGYGDAGVDRSKGGVVGWGNLLSWRVRAAS